MNKIFGILLLIFTVFTAVATDKAAEYVVVAEGYGTSRNDALKNAFKEAVYLAVGSYIMSDTKIKNDDISEKIYVNADAVITKHTVLEYTKNSDGTHYIKVRAAVVKNELANRIKKYATEKISQTGVISNSNKQDAHEQALEALQMLTRELPVNIMKIQSIGEPELNTERTSQSDMICLKQKVRISIDYRAYRKFAKQLENLLATVATKRERGIYSEQVSKRLNNKKDFNFVIFYRINHSKSVLNSYKDLSYVALKIPTPFLKNLLKRYVPWSFLLILKDSSGKNVYARSIFYINDYPLFNTCTAQIVQAIYFSPLNELHCANLFPCLLERVTDFVKIIKGDFVHDFYFEMPKAAYQQARKIEIIPVNGAKSLFLRDIQSNSSMPDLINAAYLPAINYQKNKAYQTGAAFMGYFPAQRTLQWNNGGVNCRIGKWTNGYFSAIVHDDTIPGLPKGSIVKKINGIPFLLSWGMDEQIFEIGKLAPGTEIELELDNGKKIKTELVPLDETRWQHKIPLHFDRFWGHYENSINSWGVIYEQRNSLPLDILEKLDEM